MELLRIENGVIAPIKHHAVIRETYSSGEYIDREYFLTDSEWKEWSEQQIAKHVRFELISHEDVDISAYAWVDGADVSEAVDPKHAANEMAKFTSREEYEASLPENQAEYQLDLDYRLSKLELGI